MILLIVSRVSRGINYSHLAGLSYHGITVVKSLVWINIDIYISWLQFIRLRRLLLGVLEFIFELDVLLVIRSDLLLVHLS